MKGYGNVIRIKGSLEARKALARKLLPLEDVSAKYSATASVQLPLPLTPNTLSIPLSTEKLRVAYQGKLNDMEVRAMRPIMLNTISAIKWGIASGEGKAFIALSSKVISPYLWDVLMRWLVACGFKVIEDIREVVLVEDCQNQGATRVKLMYGATILWGCCHTPEEGQLDKAVKDFIEEVSTGGV